MLVGIFLTDQWSPDMGNLWVWPGSHKLIAAHLRHHRPEALRGMAHPSLPLGQPEQIVGGPGDLLLAHYLLGHNMGGNLSASVRRVVYFRLKAGDHASRWTQCVQNPLHEFAPAKLGSKECPEAGQWKAGRTEPSGHIMSVVVKVSWTPA